MRKGQSPKTCKYCDRPSLPGLTQPLCQYHFMVHFWGKDWADKYSKANEDKRRED